MGNTTVYVIGHKNPDTDSIASAIGYAELRNTTEPGRFVPARCGSLSPETLHALFTFSAPEPVLVESVEPTVADIPMLHQEQAPPGMPAIDVVHLMNERDVRNIPIVDDRGCFLGILSEHGLARAYASAQPMTELRIGPLSEEELARILTGDVLVRAHDRLSGRVTIIIDALHVALARLAPGDIVVVGDNEPVQLALVPAGIAALIIAEGAPVGARLLEAARERGVSVIVTPLDAFSAGRMIHLSLPAEALMATDVPTASPDDPVAVAKKVVADSRYRTASVIGANGKHLGMISRNSFLEVIHRDVVLVDHNEYAQAVDGIETAEILEVIDHHRLGALSTLRPVRFLNDTVGSTSTLIARRFRESGVDPTRSTAGMLLSGILSDTLVLRMSTTTGEDRSMAAWLAEAAGVDPVTYGSGLIRSGMDLDIPATDLLSRDLKRFPLFGLDILISQVMTASWDFSQERRAELLDALGRLRTSGKADLALLLVTNVLDEGSDLFAAGDARLVESLGYADQPVRLPGVMSRKKDFVPAFGEHLRAAL